MATTARLDIRVTSSRSASKVVVSTTGRYVSTPVNTVEAVGTGLPLFTTASPKAFWLAVLAVATAQVNALP